MSLMIPVLATLTLANGWTVRAGAIESQVENRFNYATYGCNLECESVMGTDASCGECCVSCCETNDDTCNFFAWTPTAGCLHEQVGSRRRSAPAPAPAPAGWRQHQGLLGIFLACTDVTRCPKVTARPDPYRLDGGALATNSQGVFLIAAADGNYFLETPNYPDCPYMNGLDWSWKFKSLTSSDNLMVRIVELDLNDGSDCVTFNNIDNGAGSVTRCGTTLSSKSWTTTANVVNIKFTTNGFGKSVGFKIRVSVV